MAQSWGRSFLRTSPQGPEQGLGEPLSSPQAAAPARQERRVWVPVFSGLDRPLLDQAVGWPLHAGLHWIRPGRGRREIGGLGAWISRVLAGSR